MTWPADFSPALCKPVWIAILPFALALSASLWVSRLNANEPDVLAIEIERLQTYVRDCPATEDLWTQIKGVGEPVLTRASDALQKDRRLLSAYRLSVAHTLLSAGRYVNESDSMVRHDLPSFEAEWRRMGELLRSQHAIDFPRGGTSPGAPATGAPFASSAAHAPSEVPDSRYASISPVAIRALAESAVPQIGAYYDTGLEYARGTMPEYALYYLGNALAAAEWVDLCRALSTPVEKAPPRLPSLDEDIDALESELLALYRPPLSIDRHPDFITASSTLKEARELDAAGLRHGALLRYLLAAQRTASIRTESEPFAPAKMHADLAAIAARLAASSTDPSLGNLFAEIVAASAEDTAETSQVLATTVLTEVFPRYFAALEDGAGSGVMTVGHTRENAPDSETEASSGARVTVTLVRWPYT